MWNSPESRNAWLVVSVMPPRSPVISALAMAPVSPGSAATMRRPIACRTRSITARARRPSGAASASRSDLRRGAGREAHRAQSLEPGRAGEIVVAGQRRPRRRRQRRPEANGVAGLELGVLDAGAHAHARRPLPVPPASRSRQREWSGAGRCTGRGSISSTKPVTSTGPIWPLQHRRPHRFRAQLGGRHPAGQRQQRRAVISAPVPCRLADHMQRQGRDHAAARRPTSAAPPAAKKYSAMPAPNSTGSHRNQRSCSASRLRTKAASSGH